MCGDERCFGTGAFNQCVGGQRRAMDDLVDLSHVDVVFGGDLRDAVENAHFGAVLVGGEHLDRLERAVRHFDDNVGEGSTDIGTDAVTPGLRFSH